MGEGESKHTGSITINGRQSSRLAGDGEASTQLKIENKLKGRGTQELLVMEGIGLKRKVQELA